MIISNKIKIKKKGNKNISYYSDLGYDTTQDEFEVDIIHLSDNSKYLVDIKCDFCEKIVSRMYYLYLKNIASCNLFACSPKCGKNKTVITNLEKYGVEYPNQSIIVREKTKKTNLDRWGYDSPTKSDLVKNKIKETNLDRWGVEWVLQNKEVRDKSKLTMIERFGVDHNFKSDIIIENRKETYLRNWGVDNPSKSYEIKEKKKETSIKNWGVDNPNKSSEIKEKKRETNIERLGVEYPMQNKDVLCKSKNTLIEKYGVDHNSKLDFVKEDMKIKNLEKWGVEYTLQNKEIRENIKKTNIIKWGSTTSNQSDEFRKLYFEISKNENYISYKGDNISLFKCNKGHNYEISSINYHARIKSKIPLCTICHPIGNSRSIKEDEIYNYISSIYSGDIIQSYRDGLEIDIYLPEMKLGFEFNGLYWHSDEYKSKNYHREKSDYFNERGIRIIHIWEDDWDNNPEILMSQIGYLLGKSERIMARKCEVRIIDIPYISSDFMNKNHIQGTDKSNIKLGLYYLDELVSIMTFSNTEGRNKMKPGGWNLSRFCNLKGYNVVGGASKLLSYFIRKWDPSRIVSYVDCDWSIGNLYDRLGFVEVSKGRPDYKYVYDNRRVHKSNFSKGKLKYSITETEFMNEMGIFKIWDCGKKKFELILK